MNGLRSLVLLTLVACNAGEDTDSDQAMAPVVVSANEKGEKIEKPASDEPPIDLREIFKEDALWLAEPLLAQLYEGVEFVVVVTNWQKTRTTLATDSWPKSARSAMGRWLVKPTGVDFFDAQSIAKAGIDDSKPIVMALYHDTDIQVVAHRVNSDKIWGRRRMERDGKWRNAPRKDVSDNVHVRKLETKLIKDPEFEKLMARPLFGQDIFVAYRGPHRMRYLVGMSFLDETEVLVSVTSLGVGIEEWATVQYALLNSEDSKSPGEGLSVTELGVSHKQTMFRLGKSPIRRGLSNFPATVAPYPTLTPDEVAAMLKDASLSEVQRKSVSGSSAVEAVRKIAAPRVISQAQAQGPDTRTVGILTFPSSVSKALSTFFVWQYAMPRSTAAKAAARKERRAQAAAEKEFQRRSGESMKSLLTQPVPKREPEVPFLKKSLHHAR